MKSEITYFDQVGKNNTSETLNLVRERFLKGDIKHVLIATNEGNTALEAASLLKDTDARIIAISLDRNWDGKLRLSAETQKKIEAMGHVVYKGLMIFEFHRFTHDLSSKLIAEALYLFGQGIKVCVELILMSVSGELIETGEKVIAIAGTHRGADTAIVATAAPLYHFNRLEINEILCKPYHPRMKED